MRLRDASAWCASRVRNQQWLEPWEGSPPTAPEASWQQRHTRPVFLSVLRTQRRAARRGQTLPFVVTLDGRLVGQVTVSSITRGASDSGTIGYWVDRDVAGRGVAPVAVALVVDHLLAAGLHRAEVNVRPENAASRRVAEKVGFREEGLHERFLFIDGAWRDHVTYALVREDLTGSALGRLLSSRDTPHRLHQEQPRPH